MEPNLVDGQGLLAWRTDHARVGQLRCVQHPARPDFWLVKRVESVDDATQTMRVVSDNLDVDTVDSRRFGAIPIAGSYRVVLKIPMRVM